MATPSTEADLVALAAHATAAHLDRIARARRSVSANETDEANARHEARHSRGVSHLHQEHHVLRSRMAAAIGVRAGPEQGEVRLRLRMLAEANGVLDGNDCLTLQALGEDHGESVHAPSVTTADRRHLDDLSFEELHAVILSENAAVRHLVVLVNGEAVTNGLDRHVHTLTEPERKLSASYWMSLMMLNIGM
jgi:hypothetical protein